MTVAAIVQPSNIAQIQLAIQQIAMASSVGIPSGATKLNNLPTASDILTAGSPYLAVDTPNLVGTVIADRLTSDFVRDGDIVRPAWDFPCTLMWPHLPGEQSDATEDHTTDALNAIILMLATFTANIDLQVTATIASISGPVVTVRAGQPIPLNQPRLGLAFAGSGSGSQQLNLATVGTGTLTASTNPFSDQTSVAWPTCEQCELPGGANGFRRVFRWFDDNKDLPWLCVDWTVRAYEQLLSQQEPSL